MAGWSCDLVQIDRIGAKARRTPQGVSPGGEALVALARRLIAIAGSVCLCEKTLSDIVHRANRILFWGVPRSEGVLQSGKAT